VVLACLVLGGAASPDEPQPRPNAKGWLDRHAEKLREIHQGPVEMVFLGDSITEELEAAPPRWGDVPAVWRHFYGCRHAVNLGFAGDTTANLLWRIENGEVEGIQPKLAVVMIGTNNIRPAIESSVEGTAGGILAVIGALHQRLPGTRILLLGIPPSTRSAVVEDKRAQINATLASHDWHGENTTFLSVDTALETDGGTDSSLFIGAPGKPMVHPNAAGWQRLATLIEPAVERLAGEGPCTGE
jgi:lysophospholipase L1-like esterase